MAVKAIPDGYHSLTPYLIVTNAAEAIEFYRKAFNATEVMRMDGPGGTVVHAEMRIGDSRFMLADEHPELGAVAPQSPGSSGVGLCLYLENVDVIFQQAVQAGATIQRPLADQFYGDRSGTLQDPYGHTWTVATHIEDVPPDEMHRRMKQAAAL